MSTVTVRLVKSEDRPEWLRMRMALWPRCSRKEHEAEMLAILRGQEQAAFVSLGSQGGLSGFIEVSRQFLSDSLSEVVQALRAFLPNSGDSFFLAQ